MTLKQWEDVAPLLEVGVLVLTAGIATAVYIYTRGIDRKRATLDMVKKTFLDHGGAELYDAFKALVRRDQDAADAFALVELVERTDENGEARDIVINQLNIYEIIALGIRKKLFHEKIYKLWFHGQFTRDYEHVKKLIEAIQKKRPSVFCEFTWLYHRWMRRKHPINQPSWFKLVWWAATRNYQQLDRARVAMKAKS